MSKKKRTFYAVFLIFAFALLFSACEKKRSEPDVTTFELNKDGMVYQTIKGELGEDMTEEGLRSYIAELITAYCNGQETPQVVLEDIKVTGHNSVSIEMTYQSIEDYASFNHVDAFIGTVETAFKNGYTFDRSFKSAAGNGLSGYTIPVEYPGLNVIVLKEAMNVILPEDAILVSSDITINENGSFTIGRSVKSNIPEIFQTVNENCSYIVYKSSTAEENKQ